MTAPFATEAALRPWLTVARNALRSKADEDGADTIASQHWRNCRGAISLSDRNRGPAPLPGARGRTLFESYRAPGQRECSRLDKIGDCTPSHDGAWPEADA